MFDKLKKMTGGDEGRMKMYVNIFKEASTKNIEGLSAAYDLQDHGIAKEIAHSAKPLFTIIGLDHLWELANQIEITELNETDILNKGIKNLVKELQFVLIELDKT